MNATTDELQDLATIASLRVNDAENAISSLRRAGLWHLINAVEHELVTLREEARQARIAWSKAQD